MSLERLQKQYRSFDDAIGFAAELKKILHALNACLSNMTEQMRENFLGELLEDTDENVSMWGSIRLAPTDIQKILNEEDEADILSGLPTPSQCILSILEENPRGITIPELVNLSRDKFRTLSNDPDHVIRTILGQMRKKDSPDVLRDEDGNHYLSKNFPKHKKPVNDNIPF